MKKELIKFKRVLGELLIEEATDENNLDPEKVAFVQHFIDKHCLTDIFSRGLLKLYERAKV